MTGRITEAAGAPKNEGPVDRAKVSGPDAVTTPSEEPNDVPRGSGTDAFVPGRPRAEARGSDERSSPIPERLVGALLAPLRVVGNVETIAHALLALQRDAHDRLASVDERVGALRAPLDRMDDRVRELATLEHAITERMDVLRADTEARLLAVAHEVHAMRAPMERMSRDLASIVQLLPQPSDGPLARLKDTLTSS